MTLAIVPVKGVLDSGWVTVHVNDAPLFQRSAQPGRTLDTLKQPQESCTGFFCTASFPVEGSQVKTAPSGFLRPLRVHVRLASEPRSRSSRAGCCSDRLGWQGGGIPVTEKSQVSIFSFSVPFSGCSEASSPSGLSTPTFPHSPWEVSEVLCEGVPQRGIWIQIPG